MFGGTAQETLEGQLGSHFRRELSVRKSERMSGWEMRGGARLVLEERMEKMREAAGGEGEEPVGEVLDRRRGRLPKDGNLRGET